MDYYIGGHAIYYAYSLWHHRRWVKQKTYFFFIWLYFSLSTCNYLATWNLVKRIEQYTNSLTEISVIIWHFRPVNIFVTLYYLYSLSLNLGQKYGWSKRNTRYRTRRTINHASILSWFRRYYVSSKGNIISSWSHHSRPTMAYWSIQECHHSLR